MAANPYGMHVGGIDEIETTIDKNIEDGERNLFVDNPSKHIGAASKRRGLKTGFTDCASLDGCFWRLNVTAEKA